MKFQAATSALNRSLRDSGSPLYVVAGERVVVTQIEALIENHWMRPRVAWSCLGESKFPAHSKGVRLRFKQQHPAIFCQSIDTPVGRGSCALHKVRSLVKHFACLRIHGRPSFASTVE